MRKTTTLICSAFIACSAMMSYAGNNPKVIIPGADPARTPFVMPKNLKEGEDYMSKTVIFSVKPAYRMNCQANSINGILRIDDFLNSIGAYNLHKIYPNHQAPATEYNEWGQKMVDISLIYTFKYTGDMRIEKVLNNLLATGYMEWVDLHIIPKLQFVPNDPNYSNSGQYFCKGNVVGSIDCQNAWDITTGNASVIVGIVDTGTEPTHPDLSGNYAGGFDVAMNDSDPTWQGSNHGCAVSGDACAKTNNSVGVASPGFNCNFKAAKIADASGTLTAAYAGITWAADNGCKIINCSWGGSGGGSYGQTIVDYAAINKNCVIFASAGNSGLDEDLWPSSYNNVYRVAATTNTDAKASFSTYGLTTDFGSPGNGIYSTVNGTSYGSMSGTSMACPVAAGAAGLVQAKFNYSNAFQIGERLKWTPDPYASSAATLFNAGKLGTGRIDVAKAVGTGGAKSVVMNPVTVTDGNDNAFMPGETLTISGIFTNYLDPTSSACAAVLSTYSVSSGTAPTITDANSSIGALATLGTKNSSSDPFTVTIAANAPVNQLIIYCVTITDGSYTYKQYFNVTVNVDYINITINDVHTTITSKGRLGYNMDSQQQGLGFTYQLPSPNSILYEMSLMIGTSSTKVSDMFRETSGGNTDFGSVVRVAQITPPTVSDFDAGGKFNDAPAPSAIPVEVSHRAYAWNTAPYRKFVIVRYAIKNTGGSALSNLYAGIVADWDITNAGANKGNYDATNRMGYCYDVGANGVYSGIKLLTAGTANNYIIDLATGGNGGVDASSDFLTAEKYTTLSTSRNTDGYGAGGGDVMDCVSSGPFNVNAGDSIIVAFALLAGDNLTDLQASACAAQDKWDQGCTGVGINDIENDNFWAYAFPSPASSDMNINYNVVGHDNAAIRIMNSIGEVVMSFENLAQGQNTLRMDVSKLPAGSYFYQLRAGDAVMTKKFSVVR